MNLEKAVNIECKVQINASPNTVTIVNHVRNLVIINNSNDTLVIHSPTSISLVSRDTVLLSAASARQLYAAANQIVQNRTSGV